MYLVTDLKCDESLVKMDDFKNEVKNKTQERISLIARMKDRIMSSREKNRLNEIVKKPLVLLIKQKKEKMRHMRL